MVADDRLHRLHLALMRNARNPTYQMLLGQHTSGVSQGRRPDRPPNVNSSARVRRLTRAKCTFTLFPWRLRARYEIFRAPWIPTAGIPQEMLRRVKSAGRRQIISDSYPYPTKMRRRTYERRKAELQVELRRCRNGLRKPESASFCYAEGRDAAGKGGTIKRFMEHLNPRGATVVALPLRRSESAGNGTSSATCSTFRPRGRSCSSTAPGTTGAVVEP